MNFDLTVYFFFIILYIVWGLPYRCVCGSQLNILTGVKWAKDEALNDWYSGTAFMFIYLWCMYIVYKSTLSRLVTIRMIGRDLDKQNPFLHFWERWILTKRLWEKSERAFIILGHKQE